MVIEMGDNELKEKENLYFTRDNTRRLFLYDMLRRKEYLQNIKLEDLDNLVRSINTLIANLEHNFKQGKIKIEVSDRDNWASSSLFRDIFLHNILDIPVKYEGTVKMFKDKLIKRWVGD